MAQTKSDGEMSKTKSKVLEKLYNFIFDDFFIEIIYYSNIICKKFKIYKLKRKTSGFKMMLRFSPTA